jgi:hypothetical protein
MAEIAGTSEAATKRDWFKCRFVARMPNGRHAVRGEAGFPDRISVSFSGLDGFRDRAILELQLQKCSVIGKYVEQVFPNADGRVVSPCYNVGRIRIRSEPC